MKIVFFTDTYTPQINGVVSYINDIANELTKEHEVVIIAPAKKAKIEQREKRLKIYWVPSSPFPFYDGYFVASPNYVRISKILDDEKPDIVNTHIPVWLGLLGLIAAKRKKIPNVVTYHTHLPDYAPHLFKLKNSHIDKITKAAVKKMIKHTYSMADAVVAPTEELAKELREYGLKKVICLPNGVDFNRLRCSEEMIKSIKEKNNIRDKKIVLYLGRLSFEKRVDVIVEAFSKIKKTDCVLVVAGAGPDSKRLEEYVKKKKYQNIVFIGQVPSNEVGSVFAMADVFASASDSETFGLTFVESMHFGVPAVGANRFGAKEIIQDKLNGFLVEPNDVEGFSKSIERILYEKNVHQRFSKAAKERAFEYSIENSAKRLVSLYLELVQNKNNTKNHKKTQNNSF